MCLQTPAPTTMVKTSGCKSQQLSSPTCQTPNILPSIVYMIMLMFTLLDPLKSQESISKDLVLLLCILAPYASDSLVLPSRRCGATFKGFLGKYCIQVTPRELLSNGKSLDRQGWSRHVRVNRAGQFILEKFAHASWDSTKTNPKDR